MRSPIQTYIPQNKFGRGPTVVSKRGGVMIMKLLQVCQVQYCQQRDYSATHVDNMSQPCSPHSINLTDDFVYVSAFSYLNIGQSLLPLTPSFDISESALNLIVGSPRFRSMH